MSSAASPRRSVVAGWAAGLVVGGIWVFAHLVLVGLECDAENVTRTHLGKSLCGARTPWEAPFLLWIGLAGVAVLLGFRVRVAAVAGIVALFVGPVVAVAVVSLSRTPWAPNRLIWVGLDLWIGLLLAAASLLPLWLSARRASPPAPRARRSRSPGA